MAPCSHALSYSLLRRQRLCSGQGHRCVSCESGAREGDPALSQDRCILPVLGLPKP